MTPETATVVVEQTTTVRTVKRTVVAGKWVFVEQDETSERKVNGDEAT